MVGSVNTNIDAMAAIASLNSIGNQMQATQGQIESGLKVGTASDNPAVFTIAQGLRANVSALSAVSSSLATGIATIQGQTAGATSISNTLQTLLNTVTQSQNLTGTALAAANSTITAALGSIDSFANATSINGVNLLNAAGSVNVLSNINGTNTTVATTSASTSNGLGLTGLQVLSAGYSVSCDSTLNWAAAAVAPVAGTTATYTSSAGVATVYTFETALITGAAAPANQVLVGAGAAAAGANLLAAINATAGSTVATSITASGTSQTPTGDLYGLNVAGGATITSTAANTATVGGPANNDTVTFTSSATNSKAQVFTFVSALPANANQVALGGTTAQSMANMAAAMQAAGIAASAQAGVLTVTGGTVAVAEGTGNLTTGSTSAAVVNNGAATIALVNSAIAKIGTTLSALGSITTTLKGLSDFTDQLSTSVTTSLGAMVDANLSQESAQLSSLQTKQSLAIQSLSLANQGPGALLQLFR
jgi:flagellin